MLEFFNNHNDGGFVLDAVDSPTEDSSAGGFYLPGQDLLAEVPSGLAIWDGLTWSMGGVEVTGNVNRHRKAPNGDVLAAGGFSSIEGVAARNLARWDGTSWT